MPPRWLPRKPSVPSIVSRLQPLEGDQCTEGQGVIIQRVRLEDRKERFSTSLACSALRMYYLYGTLVWYFRLLVENLSLLKALVPLDYPLRALPRLFKSKRTLGRSSFLLSKVFQESWIFPHGLFQGLLKQEKGIPSKVKAKCTLWLWTV